MESYHWGGLSKKDFDTQNPTLITTGVGATEFSVIMQDLFSVEIRRARWCSFVAFFSDSAEQPNGFNEKNQHRASRLLDVRCLALSTTS